MSAYIDDPIAEAVDAAGEDAVELHDGLFEGIFAARTHQIGDRFGLRQADASVEEGAAAEFTRIGYAGAGVGGEGNDSADKVDATMTMKLGDVLAGEAPGRASGHRGAVESRVIARVANLAEMKPPGIAGAFGGYRGGRMERMPQRPDDGEGARTRESHDRDGSLAGSSSGRDNRIEGIHRRDSR